MEQWLVIWGEESNNIMSEDIIELACDGDRWAKTLQDREAFRKTCTLNLKSM